MLARIPLLLAAGLAAPAAAQQLNTILFNMTLSPMDPIIHLLGSLEPTFLDLVNIPYQEGLVGTGPVRLYSNSSSWASIDRPSLSFSYTGTEFYVYGWWEAWNTLTNKPLSVWWNGLSTLSTHDGAPVLQPGPDGTSLIADSLVLPNGNPTAISSAGNASLVASIMADPMNPSRVGSRQGRLSVNSAAGGGRLTISGVTVTCLMETEATSINDVKVSTVPFVVDGRANPYFNYSDQWVVVNGIGGIGGQPYTPYPFLNHTIGQGLATVTVPVPPNTGFMYVTGVRFPRAGPPDFVWTPDPPYAYVRGGELSPDLNSSYIYPGAIMQMQTLDPRKTYTLTIKPRNMMGLDSAVFYSASLNGTGAVGIPSHPSTTAAAGGGVGPTAGNGAAGGKSESHGKLSAGAIAGIAVGAVVGVALIAAAMFFLGRRHFRRELAHRTSRFVDMHTDTAAAAYADEHRVAPYPAVVVDGKGYVPVATGPPPSFVSGATPPPPPHAAPRPPSVRTAMTRGTALPPYRE